MKKISDSAVRRLSLYARILQEAADAAAATISSGELASRVGTTSAQVRKDLSLFGSFGKRGLGYDVRELLARIRDILGVNRQWNVALVGGGKIGAALFSYRDFARRGFRIVAVFDSDPAKVGQRWGEVAVRSEVEIESVLAGDSVELVIIAVPADSAQAVVDRVARAGVRAILNFAPTRLRVPRGVALRNVDLTLELEGLAFAALHP